LQNHELGCGASIAGAKNPVSIAQPAALPRVTPRRNWRNKPSGTIRQLKATNAGGAPAGHRKTTLYRKLKEYGLSENVSLETLEPMNGNEYRTDCETGL